jgi:protein-tyrosine phosphatase
LPAGERIISVVGHTELHFHLLPGVDDGPATMEESLALARAAVADGTHTIVTTPHVQESLVTDVAQLPERVALLRAALRRAGIPIRVLCGGELAHSMVPRLARSELDLIAHGPRGRRWLLLEAPFQGLDEEFSSAAARLRAQGFSVVIAHPERALPYSPRGWQIIADELAAGSGLQINAWSVAGAYGETVREHAIRAARSSSLVALASDAHGATRPPALHQGLAALASAGIAEPERLAGYTPAALLERGLPLRPRAVAA